PPPGAGSSPGAVSRRLSAPGRPRAGGAFRLLEASAPGDRGTVIPHPGAGPRPVPVSARRQGAPGRVGASARRSRTIRILMDVTAQAGRLPEAAADTIVVNLFQGTARPGGATGAVDAALEGAITRFLATGDFAGQANETAVLYPRLWPGGAGGITATRILLVGLGKREELTLDRVRQVAGTAARRARELGGRVVATALHGAGAGGLAPGAAAQALAEGSLLGLYRFLELTSSPEAA